MVLNIADQLQVERAAAVGQRVVVVGKSGSGKSYTLAVVAEEWLNSGWALTVIDPMASMLHLRGNGVIVASSAQRVDEGTADIAITTANAPALALFSVRERIAVVVDTSLYSQEEGEEIVELYLKTIWRAIFAQRDPLPYALIIDEAQMYAPQDSAPPLRKVIVDVAKRGRHKSPPRTWPTATASIDKNFLTQATLLIAHRLTFSVDTKVLREQLPLPERELNGLMRKLVDGQAIVIGEPRFIGQDDYRVVQVRPRVDVPPPAVPLLDEGQRRTIDDGLREALAELAKKSAGALDADLAESTPATPPNPDLVAEVEQLRRENAHLSQAGREQQAEVEQLRKLNAELWRENESLRAAATVGALPQPTLIAPEPPASSARFELQAQERQEKQKRSAVTRQQNRFKRVVGELQTLPKQDRLVLMYLIGVEGQATLDEIAHGLGYSESTLAQNPPTALLQTRYVTRTRTSGRAPWQWKSVVRSRLRDEFPDLDTETLVEQLFRDLT